MFKAVFVIDCSWLLLQHWCFHLPIILYVYTAMLQALINVSIMRSVATFDFIHISILHLICDIEMLKQCVRVTKKRK